MNTELTEAERRLLDDQLLALWQARTERVYEHCRTKVEELIDRAIADRFTTAGAELTEDELVLIPLWPVDPIRPAVIAWVERILAARTSTATADTGLRERVEAVLYDNDGNNRMPQWFTDEVLAALDATPASTEDRADNEGTRP